MAKKALKEKQQRKPKYQPKNSVQPGRHGPADKARQRSGHNMRNRFRRMFDPVCRRVQTKTANPVHKDRPTDPDHRGSSHRSQST